MMKKLVKWISILVMAAVITCLLPDCCYVYGDDTCVYENATFYLNAISPRCFVGQYTWPEGTTEVVFRIPDRVNGHRVTSIGGFIGIGSPTAFWVDIPGTVGYCSERDLPEDAVVEQYHLTIVLGKYIRDTDVVFVKDYYHMGDNKFVQVVVTVDLADNRYFGLSDGRLYRKVDGELVEGFFYAADYLDN